MTKGKLFAILVGMFLFFLPMSAVKAETLPDFNEEPVAITGFEVWDAPKTQYYDFESPLRVEEEGEGIYTKD